MAILAMTTYCHPRPPWREGGDHEVVSEGSARTLFIDCQFPQSGRLDDHHLHSLQSCSAGRINAKWIGPFNPSLPVDGSHHDFIFAASGRVPAKFPEHPDKRRGVAENIGILPGAPSVETQLNGLDAIEIAYRITEKVNIPPSQFRAILEVGKTSLRPAFSVVRPAASFPIAQIRPVHKSNAGDPFWLLHAEFSGNKDARGISVDRRQGVAIHAIGQKVVFIPDALNRM